MTTETNFDNEYNAWLDSLPVSQHEPKASTIATLIDDVPAAIADNYDSALEFARDVERFWNIDECMEYPCSTTLDRALHLARHMDHDDFHAFHWQFMEVCKDSLLRRKADDMMSARRGNYRS